MKWFLINEDDFKTVQSALELAVQRQKQYCDDTDCWCGVDTPEECHVVYEKALHDLNTGLNSTDCIPADFV